MAKKIPPQIKKIVEETQNELKKIYNDRFKGLILFGSYARGDYGEGSDIDLALLVEEAQDSITERKKFFPVTSRISLKYDTVVSVIPFDINEFHQKRTPLVLNINKEGIKI